MYGDVPIACYITNIIGLFLPLGNILSNVFRMALGLLAYVLRSIVINTEKKLISATHVFSLY